MINYQMPVIRNIEELLPHIEGFPEISVNTKADYAVVNYHVAFEKTFSRDIPGWEWRRECRGIIFHKDTGKLLRRPFHKFFNVGELPETSFENMVEVIKEPHLVMDKADGSMIAPFFTEGGLRAGTKAGVTDISEKAEMLLTLEQHDILETMVQCGFTPILEYVAPDNKIVVNYPYPKLIMTATRTMLTGEYINLTDKSGFELIKNYGHASIDDFDKFVKTARGETGIEGYIIRHKNGMVKLKNDWYVQIHKTKDNLRFEHNILAIILDEQLDDLIPVLDEVDKELVYRVKHGFESGIEKTIARIQAKIDYAKTELQSDRKRVALEVVPTLEHKNDAKFIFQGLKEGSELRADLIKYSRGHCNGQTNYAELKAYLGY